MKKLVILVAIVSIALCGVCIKRTVQEKRFNITGTVIVPERLVAIAESDNNACAIIVKNELDVPVAIKRVINPKFPLNFTLGEEDLLAEDFGSNLKLEVQINKHGQLGLVKEGDVFGSFENSIRPQSKDIHIQADKTMGKVQLARNAKGNFFRTAAR